MRGRHKSGHVVRRLGDYGDERVVEGTHVPRFAETRYHVQVTVGSGDQSGPDPVEFGRVGPQDLRAR